MHRISRIHLSIVVLLALAGLAPAAAPPPPDWFLESLRGRTTDGGLWITDNAEYLEEDGGIDAYGIEWTAGFSATSMTGRLFGLRDGEETGTYWQFRTFWHPGTGEVRVYQFGADGTVGMGTLEIRDSDGAEILVQDFYRPDGGSYRTRHVTLVDGDREQGTSENWVDGAWETGRRYVWYRQG